jgi:hypothetical protein
LVSLRFLRAHPQQAPRTQLTSARRILTRDICLTKSRRFSTNFKDLRQTRVDHVREQLLTNGDQKQRDLAQTAPEQRVTRFDFVGIGHLTTADAYLAAQAAARAREHRQLAREALYDHHNRRMTADRDLP